MSIDTEESLVLPSTESVAETVESFNNYFQEKIDKIRSNFAIPEPDDEVYKHFSGCHLSQFEPTTIAERSLGLNVHQMTFYLPPSLMITMISSSHT